MESDMSRAFEIALERVLKIEGGFADHKDDPGGKTSYGITAQLARAYGYKGRMYDLPLSMAAHIYDRHFWRFLACDRVHEVSPDLAWKLFDIGVNCGRERAAEWFQRVINLFNRQGRDYGDIKVDGWIGDRTIAALRAHAQTRRSEGLVVLVRALTDRQGMHYQSIAERAPQFETFMYGWYNQRIINA